MEFVEVEPLEDPEFEPYDGYYSEDGIGLTPSRGDIGRLISERVDDVGLDIFVWPWTGTLSPPNPVLDGIEYHNDVDTIFSAGGIASAAAREENNIEGRVNLDVESPDYLELPERGVTSHDVADALRDNQNSKSGISQGFDVEYSRDFGMALAYHSQRDLNQDNYSQEDIDNIIDGLSEDSRDLVSQGGIAILDLHDYSHGGMGQNPYISGEDRWETDKKHVEHVIGFYEDKFEEVEAALKFFPASRFDRSEREKYETIPDDLYDLTFEKWRKRNAKPYVIAKNPLK